MTQQANTVVRPWKSFLMSTAVMGLVVLVPLAILFLAAMEVYGLLDDMANFADFAFPFPCFVNAARFVVLAVLAVFAVCVLTGLLLLTGPGRKFGEFVKKGISDKVP